MTESEVQKLFTEYPFGKAKQMLVDEIERSGHSCTGNETVFELRALALQSGATMTQGSPGGVQTSAAGKREKTPSGAPEERDGGLRGADPASERNASNGPYGANGGIGGEGGGENAPEPGETEAESPQRTPPAAEPPTRQANFLAELDKAARELDKSAAQQHEQKPEPQPEPTYDEVAGNDEPEAEGDEEEVEGEEVGNGEENGQQAEQESQPEQPKPEPPKEERERGSNGGEQGQAQAKEQAPQPEQERQPQGEDELESAAKGLMEQAAKYMDEAKKLRDERRRREEEERRKKEAERQKQNRHSRTDEVVKRLKTLGRAFLVGPSGTGKSTLAMCACRELFGIEGTLEDVVKSGKFAQISFSPDTVSADMLGFTDVNGVFHETEIIRVFRDGGVILFDEMDDADASLLVKLNTMLANRVIPIPGKMVVQHPNCYIVGTANTYGKGGDSIYVGRSRLDGATLDRWKMATIRVEYDEGLETRIIGKALAKRNIRACYEIKAVTTAIRELIEKNKWKQICSTRFVIDASEMMKNGYNIIQVLNTFLLDWNEANARLVMESAKSRLSSAGNDRGMDSAFLAAANEG